MERWVQEYIGSCRETGPLFPWAGVGFEIAKILVRDLNKPRAVEVDRSILTADPREVLDDPEIAIVVELIGA